MTSPALSGSLQLANAIEVARKYMFDETKAPWVEDNPLQKAAAERQLANMLGAALNQGFALHDPLHPELRYFDQMSQFGLFNPDNRYYMATIEYPGEYVIKGKLGTSADINIQVGGGQPGFDPEQVNLDPISLLTKADIKADANGEFEIVISETNDNDHVNWMANNKPCGDDPKKICGATSILIRESFMDWENEKGGTWYLERTDTGGQSSPVVTPQSVDEQYARAASYLINGTIGWVDFVAERIGGDDEDDDAAVTPRNLRGTTPAAPSLTFPSVGDDGLVGQFNSFGVFPLFDPTFAYIVSVKKHPTARYQSIQLGDLWFNSLDYCRRQISLNMHQAQESSDGYYHFVVSAQDPGLANWLDPSGVTMVTCFLRWQGVKGNGKFRPAFAPEVKRVALSSIRDHFPADEPEFTVDQRKEQMAVRQAVCLGNPRGF